MHARSAPATLGRTVQEVPFGPDAPAQSLNLSLGPDATCAHLQQVQDLPSPCSPLPAGTLKTSQRATVIQLHRRVVSLVEPPGAARVAARRSPADNRRATTAAHFGYLSQRIASHARHRRRVQACAAALSAGSLPGLHLYFLEGGLLTAAQQQPCQHV